MRLIHRLAKPIFVLTAAATVAACQTPVVTATLPGTAKLDVKLEPPAAADGVQVQAGPFFVEAGQDVQRNFHMKLPSDTDVWIKRIEIVYPPGSHHCNIFKSDTKNVPDHVDETFDAMYPDWDMFANSQSGNLDWTFPEGVAMKLKAHQQLLIQTHYVNTLTQGTPAAEGVVKVNFHYAKPEEVKMTMGMMFAVNPSLSLAPHSEFKAQKAISLADQGFFKDVKIAAMSGHMHSRGRSFEVNRWTGRDPEVLGESIYKSANWAEPPMEIYKKPIDWKASERLIYTGMYVNNTDIFIGFGAGNVDTKEHSNLFLYFYPGPEDGKAIYDVEASQFQEVSEI